MNEIAGLKNLIEELIAANREDDWWDFKQCHHQNKADLLHDIICLAYSLGAKDNGPFTFHRVTYIPFVSIDTNGLADLGSDCMVFDLGCDFKSGLSRLLLCDIKIIVGNDAVWRMGEYDKLESFPSIYGVLSSWRLFVNLGNIKHMREKDRYGMTVCCFPFEPDPVYPGNDTVDFLKEAIYG